MPDEPDSDAERPRRPPASSAEADDEFLDDDYLEVEAHLGGKSR